MLFIPIDLNNTNNNNNLFQFFVKFCGLARKSSTTHHRSAAAIDRFPSLKLLVIKLLLGLGFRVMSSHILIMFFQSSCVTDA
jgi:hypothetical protein